MNIIGDDDIELIDYNYPVSIVDVDDMKPYVQFFDATISALAEDVNIFLLNYIDMAEKIFIVRRVNTYGEKEFIRITDFKDICQYTET